MHVVLVAVAWLYVALMMAAAEASSPVGSVLGAFITFVLYGVLPLLPLLYILSTPARRRARRAREAAPQASSDEGDGRHHASAGPIAAEREEA